MSESEEKFKVVGDAKMWAKYGNAFSPCEESVNTLPPGQYTIGANDSIGIYFMKKEIILDGTVELPDSVGDEVLDHIKEFWKLEKRFREFEVLWKRGILLWGPPGSGKTTTVQQVSKMVIDMGGLSVYVNNPKLAATALEMFRRIEAKRPMVVMLEDLDAIVNPGSSGESDLLALLDGELQIENVVFIATTNYPEKLDRRLVNRPSRFDIVKKIGMPSAAARRAYLVHKCPVLGEETVNIHDSAAIEQAKSLEREIKDLTEETSPESMKELRDEVKAANKALKIAKVDSSKEDSTDTTLEAEAAVNEAVEAVEAAKAKKAEITRLKKEAKELRKNADRTEIALDYWVERTEDYSIAYLKELVLSVKAFDVKFEDAIARLDKMMGRKPSSTDGSGSGF